VNGLSSFRNRSIRGIRAYIALPTGRYVVIGLVYLLLISIAETITTLVEPQLAMVLQQLILVLGMVLYGLVLVLLLIHGSLIHRGVLRRFLIVLSLAPLIRILSLSLPLRQWPLIYWYLVIGMLLFLAVFIAGRVTDLGGNRIGWSWRGWPLQLTFGLFGFGLGYVEYLILQPGPLVDAISLHADDGKVRPGICGGAVCGLALGIPFIFGRRFCVVCGFVLRMVGMENPFPSGGVPGAWNCEYQPLCHFSNADQRGVSPGGIYGSHRASEYNPRSERRISPDGRHYPRTYRYHSGQR
jgi:hypothetical protein